MNAIGGALLADAAQATELREWFTAAELADLGLPGLPADKRAINRRARDDRWREAVDAEGCPLARERAGRGGGQEFHASLLPAAARLELARRGLIVEAPQPVQETPAEAAWRWYAAQTDKTKAEAERCLRIVQAVEQLEGQGLSRTVAVAEAARINAVGASSVWEYFKRIRGLNRSDWLPALAPRRRGGGVEAEIDHVIWTAFKSDFCRPEEPTLASCYQRAVRLAEQHGLPMPTERTMRRRLERDLDPRVVRRMRKGDEAYRRSIPAQRRTVEHLHAMEWVNIDGHVFDVKVISRAGKEIRPVLVGIQDVRSSKLLAWRVCETESAHHVRLVFASLFEGWGIPVHCVLDNGRGFASKWITGGTANRFRFKVKDSDPVGLLTGLGVKVHWALPFHGQSKPIERAWMDLTDTISRHPFVAGAYTGRSPMHKPANHGSKAVPWDDFVGHVAREIAHHNARSGRRGRDYRGRSFDEVFSESYAAAPIGKATADQLRLALLAAEQKMVNRQTGEIQLFGARYWSEDCARLGLHGQRVTVRFDPDDLSRPVHLYDLEGRYLCSAEAWNDVLFDSADAAKQTAKFMAEQRRTIRKAEEAEQFLAAPALAAMHLGLPEPIKAQPKAKVVRAVRHRGQTAAALKLVEMPAAAPRRDHESKVFEAMGEAFRLRAVE